MAVRSHIGMALPAGVLADDASGPRLCVRWMGGFFRGGLHLVSLYPWCTEGLSTRNLDFLQNVAAVLARLRGPWLIGADFTVTPDVLSSSGWLRLVG